MPTEILLTLIFSGIAVVSFAIELIPSDVTALGLMLALVISGILTPQEAFSGFGSDTVLMILGLLIMSSALSQTGVVDFAGQLIFNLTEAYKKHTVLIITSAVAFLSAFISNTAAAAFFLPAVIGFARKSNQSPSQFLLPLAFASILTSSVTVISSSTNIVISDMLTRYNQPPIGMFEMAPIGLPISIIGLFYLTTIGMRLMPKHSFEEGQDEEFGLKPYLSEIVLTPESTMVGKKLVDCEIVKNLRFDVLRILRNKNYLMPKAASILKEGDILLVEGTKEQILAIKDIKGIEIKPEAKLAMESAELDGEEPALVEAVIPHRSRMIGKTLKDLGLRDKYEIVVLAINRSGTAINKKMSQTPLNVGDVILLQGDKQEIQILNDNNLITIIGSVARNKVNRSKAPIAIAAFCLAIGLATFKVISFPVAALIGAFVVFVSGCITPEESYREVDWKVLILIGCMISLGVAMEKTGAGVYLSKHVIALLGTSDFMLLSGFFIFALVLTQAMSNQAAAIVLVPIAIPTASALGIDSRALVMTIAVAASCSYLTPLEPACLMVYGPGRYRFRDFFIVGLPLTVIIYIMAVLINPLIWPLRH